MLTKLECLEYELSRGANFEIIVMRKLSFEKLTTFDGFHRFADLVATEEKMEPLSVGS